MRKVIGSIVTLALIGFLLAGCANPASEVGVEAGAKIAVITVQESDIAVAVGGVEYLQSTRTTTGSDKISPNDYNASFPGIFFFWNTIQDDDGILKVEAGYFERFLEFILTVKDSNIFWDFRITLQKNQKLTPDNCYTFIIPREIFSDKDIKAVFLNDMVESKTVFYRSRVEPTPERGLISFVASVRDVRGRVLPIGEWFADSNEFTFEIWDGENCIASDLKVDADGKVTYDGPNVIPGKDYTIREIISEEGQKKYISLENNIRISQSDERKFTLISSMAKSEGNSVLDISGSEKPESWSAQLQVGANAGLLAAMMGIKDEEGVPAEWVWNMCSAPLDASSAIIDTEEFYLPPGFSIPDAVYFYLASDNAAVVYVNGKWVGCTGRVLGDDLTGSDSKSINFQTVEFAINSEWARVYRFDIASALIEGQWNNIKIYSAKIEAPGAERNPAGLLFACSFSVEKAGVGSFVNEIKESYGFWAGINLTTTGVNGSGSASATATMIDGEPYMTGSGWQTYIKVEGLSKFEAQSFNLINNNVIVGKAVLSVRFNELSKLIDLVVTIELFDGRLIGTGNENVKIMISKNPNDVLSQGNYLYKAQPPEMADGKYEIIVPANHVAKVQGNDVSAFNLYTYRE